MADQKPHPVRNISLLFVEDEDEARQMLNRMLGLNYPGLTIYVAQDGASGLALFREHRPEIVLTDINMPVMNGEQLVSRIKHDRLLGGIPVVVVSTDQSEHRMRHMLELGASGYVSKPFVPEMLRLEVERVLGRAVAGACHA